MEIFKDNNNWNEKSIIGAVAFIIMCMVMILDLLTGWLGRDLAINEFVYDSFVLVVLGCFGLILLMLQAKIPTRKRSPCAVKVSTKGQKPRASKGGSPSIR